MRHAIETAPKDGHFVILEDDASAIYDVGRWSQEAGDWVGKDAAPLKIMPTHWHPFARDAYLQSDDEGAVVADPVGKSEWRRVLTPVVFVIAAATILVYYVNQEASQPPVSTIGDGIVAHNTRLPSRDLKTALTEVRREVEREASQPTEEPPTVRERRAAATPMTNSQQSLDRKPPDILAQEAPLAQELGEARRTIERLEAQLQSGPTAEQALKQERERAAVLTEHAGSARQALLAETAQYGRALEQERARSAVLASELVLARREIETQTAQSRQANTEAALFKQAETAKTEQLVQQQRQTMAALAEAAAARQELKAYASQHVQALDEERALSAVLASELATARHEIESQSAQLRQANNELALTKQAETTKTGQLLEQHRQNGAVLAEAVAARQELTTSTAEQSRAIDQERARSAALASELATARRELEAQAALLRQDNAVTSRSIGKAEQSEQLRGGIAAALADASAAREELQTSAVQHYQALEDERARSVTLASELATARREIETHVMQSRQVESDRALLKQAATAKDEKLLEQQHQREAALAKAMAAREELIANTAQHRQALGEERARIATLESELAAAHQANGELVVQFRLIGEQTELRRRAYEAETSALQQALKQQRDTATWAVELDASRRPASARNTPETTGSLASRDVTVTAGNGMATPAASDVQGAEAARMLARAGVVLGQGDIGAARIVLERAVELGSARALFMLAETYDPGVLSTWRTYGTRGEVTRARELYAKAHAAGISEAKERLDNVGR